MRNLMNEDARLSQSLSAAQLLSAAGVRSLRASAWSRMKGSLFVVLLALSVVLGTGREARAGAGELDPTFGSGGKVAFDMAHAQSDAANAIAVQPDGKIIVGGEIEGSSPSSSRAVLLRLNPDGSLDQSFGSGGSVISNAQLHINGLALQPDGKILAAGGITGAHPINFGLVRYNPDGSLDQSFGSGGFTTVGPQNFTVIQSDSEALLLQPDGKIVVAGYMTIYPNGDKFAIARFNVDGSLDQSFGTNGSYITTSSQNDRALAVALQADGKIVASGYATTAAATRDFALARFNSNGSPDLNFGLEGKLTTNFSFRNYAHAYGVAIQPDGKIVAVGGFTKLSDGFLLVRYDEAGHLDQSFGQGGRVTTSFGSGSGSGQAVLLQPDGKIVVAGSVSYNGTGNEAVVLARYNPNGSFDQNFGSNGFLITDFNPGTLDEARALALQPNGRLVLAGYASEPSGSYTNFAAARYLIAAPHSTPSDFDGDGHTDFAVFQPGNGFWYVQCQAGASSYKQLGLGGDIPVPGDYDGDRLTDIAVFRPSDGTWHLIQSTNGALALRVWGQSGDIPVPGDYDGDGRTDAAVFRPAEGNWYILYSGGGNAVRNWGADGDKPVVGDFDGDGRADLAIFRPADGNWYIIRSSTNTAMVRGWGISGDRPVPGDYDGDGLTDVAVWRPSDGNWYIINSSAGSAVVRNWGEATDMPVPGDYDGDGRTDIAVWRPGEGTWYIISSSTNAGMTGYLGGSGDIPVASAYLPQ